MKDLYGKEIPQSEIDAYELEMIKFEARCLGKMPYLKDTLRDVLEDLVRIIPKAYGLDPEKYSIVIDARKKLKEYSQWEMMRSCDAPNRPGYYRANND